VVDMGDDGEVADAIKRCAHEADMLGICLLVKVESGSSLQ
jgi:anthranilate/para-aminobenzoate synthase component II